MDIKIITGLSGAGKSSVVDKLEDMGYYCIDNLPPALLEKFVELIAEKRENKSQKVAIVIDIRGRAFFDELKEQLEKLLFKYPNTQIVFLEASISTLVKRFKETRRTHPLSIGGENENSMIDAIEKEIKVTQFLKDMAHKVIDTSSMSRRELDLLLIKIFADNPKEKISEIIFNSFGFKHGIPLHADMVFDVRFIENPHYVKELRPLTGEDKDVYDFIFAQEIAENYYKKMYELLDYSFKAYLSEGRSQITVSIGCTGGRHRSVAFACRLASDFKKQGFKISLNHRDKNKA